MPRFCEVRGNMIVCGDRPKPKCYICGKPAPFLCDYILQFSLENPTCDRPLCEEHRVKKGPNIDYCPEHEELSTKMLTPNP